MSKQAADQLLRSQVDDGKTPSVQYILFDQDYIIHRLSYGLANVAGQIPATDQTTYSGFSTTKTFTALAILQLAEKGKLSLDDKASVYLDAFPYGDAITIRQLLAHAAGIPNPLPLRWVHLPSERAAFDRNQFFAAIFAQHSEVKSAPNEKFTYSNLGYVLLGQIIERVSGLSYEAYVETHILQAIQATPTELGFEFANLDRHAKGYQKRVSIMNFLLGFMMDKSKYKDQTEDAWISFKPIHLHGAAHGGLIGTADGFRKYLQALLRADSGLISEASKSELFGENLNNDQEKTGMSLSWFVGQLNGQTYYAHAGGGPGHYSEIRLYPELGLGSVIMFNRSGMRDERFLDRVDGLLLDL